ncbi:MAG TPA: hypothetical protein VNM48_22375 [Chloroflexota bacterium]|nr:hypothetical protein [Chloroflexota bacterium]
MVGRPDIVTRHSSRLALVLALALILFHVAIHRDAGGWEAKGAIVDTVLLDHHLVEWEWAHVGRIAQLLEAQVTPFREVNTQDLYRLAGPFLMALIRPPGVGAYDAALVATMIGWLAAAWSLFLIGRRVRSASAGIAAAALAGSGTGYVAFIGNVDAHQFGYAAVTVWLGLAVAGGAFGALPFSRGWSREVGLGLALCLAGYAMEVAYPLLLFTWLYYGGKGVLAGAWRPTLGRLGVVTLSFAVPYFGFRLVAEQLLFEQVVAFNEPFDRLAGRLTVISTVGVVPWLRSLVEDTLDRWPALFPLPVTLLALVGAFAVPRRWLLWCVLSTGTIFFAVLVVKPAFRDLFLAAPGVYVLAACGADWLATGFTRRVLPRGGQRAALLQLTVTLALIAPAVALINADLWGDYWLPYMWHGRQ